MNAIAASSGTLHTGGVGNAIGTLFGVLTLITIKAMIIAPGLGIHGGRV